MSSSAGTACRAAMTAPWCGENRQTGSVAAVSPLKRSAWQLAGRSLGLARVDPAVMGSEATGVLAMLAGRLADQQRANGAPDSYWAETRKGTVPGGRSWSRASRGLAVASSDHEAGDPRRAGQAILELVAMPEPPLRLLLGNMAFDNVTAAHRRQLEE